jgi:hypothetical protein
LKRVEVGEINIFSVNICIVWTWKSEKGRRNF